MNGMNRRPLLGITMGDPCGIGPEITAKALSKQNLYAICRPLVVGSAKVLAQAAAIVKADVRVKPVTRMDDAGFRWGVIDVLDQDVVDMETLALGKISAQGGNAAFLAIRKVIEMALAGEVDGTVTGPINKEALNLAGWHYAGHTEIFAEKTGTQRYAMMLAHGNLRVLHVSTHVSLREACDRCKKDRVLQVIRLADETCKRLGIFRPRIGVAGLNPHAGENGLFGREEIEEIAPAIETAREEGMDAQGPFPPDTIFSKAYGGQYDVVVAQYHDQGHIPLKLIGFQLDAATGLWKSVAGVNITLGLPIIRSSVDHGTAFDQAGKGTATEESLENAIEYGVQLALHRHDGG